MATALFYTAPGRCALREVKLPEKLSAGEVRVRAIASAVSRGTERLVSEGRVPESERERMRAPFQIGDFPFPVAYGYQSVGKVVEGDQTLVGQRVFCLAPHMDEYVVPAAAVVPLPSGLAPERAVLGANMETALNGVWDGRVAPGDRVAVIGGGVVGCLVAVLCSRIPGTEVMLIDLEPSSLLLPPHANVRIGSPDDAPTGCDVTFNASASGAGLATALRCAADDSPVVEMSWHGEGAVGVPLGADFHARRLRIVSSQVGRLPPDRRGRWDHRRRMEKALELLMGCEALVDGLGGPTLAFEGAADALPDLLSGSLDPRSGSGVAPVLRYGG